jgi:hypothetical protein
MVDWLFGRELVLAVAVADGHVVWAAGRDWRVRLEGMLAAARGDATRPSLANDARWIRATRDLGHVVSVAYLAVAPVARFVREAMKVSGAIDERHEAAIAPFTADEEGAIVSASRVAAEDGRAVYEVSSTVPTTIASELGGIGGAMWRVAVAPLLGPPALPPLPAPPPAVTPPATAPEAPAPGRTPLRGPELPTGRGA